MSRLQPSPEFTSSADLFQHYVGVRARLLWRRHLPVVMPLLLTYQPGVNDEDEPREFVEIHTVQDIVPRQRLSLPENTRCLTPEAQMIATRRAIAAYLRGVAERPMDARLDIVKSAVSAAFKINRHVLTHPSRRPGPVRVRQIAISMAHRFTNNSLNEIGRAFGGRDHATVHYGAMKMASLIDTVIAEMFDGKSCSVEIPDAA